LAASGYSLDDMVDAATRNEGRLKQITYFDMLRLNKAFPRYYWKGLKKNHLDFRNVEDIIRNFFRFESPLSTDGIEEYMRNAMTANDFKSLDADLFIIATRLNPIPGTYKDVFCKKDFHNAEFEAQYRSDVKISDAVAASCAVPGILAPRTVRTNSHSIDFIDGETRKTLSTHVARDAGADLIFVSHTYVPYTFKEEIGSLKKYGMYTVATQAVYILVSQKIENAKLIYGAKRDAVNSVKRFIKESKMPKNMARKLMKGLLKDLRYNPDLVQITTCPSDPEFFMKPHFSPDKDCAKRIIEHGYEQGLKDLSGYRFEL